MLKALTTAAIAQFLQEIIESERTNRNRERTKRYSKLTIEKKYDTFGKNWSQRLDHKQVHTKNTTRCLDG